MKKICLLLKNMLRMTLAAITLIVGAYLVIDWYDHPTHLGNLLIAAFILYDVVIRFLIKVDYGEKDMLKK